MSSPPPRRDKFAALAAQHREAQEQATSPVASTDEARQVAASVSIVSLAPKRDKFAAMAAQSAMSTDPPQQQVTVAKRDKFAAMAAQVSSPSVPPTRDKFASMAAAAAPSAAVNSRLHAESVDYQQQQVAENDRHEKLQALAKWEKLSQQRKVVWDDLERAEALAIRLLDLAEQTTCELAERTVEEGDLTVVKELSSQFQKNLSEIHKRLHPHAHLVQAYHVDARHVHRNYLKRVDLRIAQSKLDLLHEYKQSLVTCGSMNAAGNDGEQLSEISVAKRKREES